MRDAEIDGFISENEFWLTIYDEVLTSEAAIYNG